MNLGELKERWSIPGPWAVHSIAQGDNNLTWLIETPSGNYILRKYHSDRLLEKIRYELNVLESLQHKSLTFQVPAPVPTVTGELYAILAGMVTTLSPWLPGSLPQSDNLAQTFTAGQALAELGKALQDLQVVTTSQVVPFQLSGDFDAWAGITLEPAKIIHDLPLAEKERDQIHTLIDKTRAIAPTLYQTLPQQIIHRDYDQSNILMQGNFVTGVLDFEFCGYDLRILDLAYALSQWPSGLWNSGKEWAVLDSFAKGYLSNQRLSLNELEMLPLVFRLRATTSLYFRLGRFISGHEKEESLLERIHETLENENWLSMHEKELLNHARSWVDY